MASVTESIAPLLDEDDLGRVSESELAESDTPSVDIEREEALQKYFNDVLKERIDKPEKPTRPTAIRKREKAAFERNIKAPKILKEALSKLDKDATVAEGLATLGDKKLQIFERLRGLWIAYSVMVIIGQYRVAAKERKGDYPRHSHVKLTDEGLEFARSQINEIVAAVSWLGLIEDSAPEFRRLCHLSVPGAKSWDKADSEAREKQRTEVILEAKKIELNDYLDRVLKFQKETMPGCEPTWNLYQVEVNEMIEKLCPQPRSFGTSDFALK